MNKLNFLTTHNTGVSQIALKKEWYLFWLTEKFLCFGLNPAKVSNKASKNTEIPYITRIFGWYLFRRRDTYSEAKKDIMASNPRNLTISGVFLAFPRFFATMGFADTECRKKDIISKKRLRTGCWTAFACGESVVPIFKGRKCGLSRSESFLQHLLPFFRIFIC